MEEKLTAKDVKTMFGNMAEDILNTKFSSYSNMIDAEYGRIIATHPEYLKGDFRIKYEYEHASASVHGSATFTKLSRDIVYYNEEFVRRCINSLQDIYNTYIKYCKFLSKDVRPTLSLKYSLLRKSLFESTLAYEIDSKQEKPLPQFLREPRNVKSTGTNLGV